MAERTKWDSRYTFISLYIIGILFYVVLYVVLYAFANILICIHKCIKEYSKNVCFRVLKKAAETSAILSLCTWWHSL